MPSCFVKDENIRNEGRWVYTNPTWKERRWFGKHQHCCTKAHPPLQTSLSCLDRYTIVWRSMYHCQIIHNYYKIIHLCISNTISKVIYQGFLDRWQAAFSKVLHWDLWHRTNLEWCGNTNGVILLMFIFQGSWKGQSSTISREPHETEWL